MIAKAFKLVIKPLDGSEPIVVQGAGIIEFNLHRSTPVTTLRLGSRTELAHTGEVVFSFNAQYVDAKLKKDYDKLLSKGWVPKEML